MRLLALIVLFLTVPFLELAIILEVVGPALGAPLTIVLLAADSFLGAVLLRSQGRVAWRRFNETLAAGALPHREVIDGVLVIFGGALLLTPGFVTDAVGLLLLLPPSRAAARSVLLRRLSRRIFGGPGAEPHVRRERRQPRPPARRAHDVEGTATEHDRPTPRLER